MEWLANRTDRPGDGPRTASRIQRRLILLNRNLDPVPTRDGRVRDFERE